MLPTDLPAKQARLVLPLVWGTSQYQSILLPDTAAGQIKSGIMERLPEDQSFGIRMEHIDGCIIFHVLFHIYKCCKLEFENHKIMSDYCSP